MTGSQLSASNRELVSIVIVNYNGAGLLDACLQSVYAQTYRPIEVIVVDNASVDNSIAMVREKYPETVVIESPINLGFAGGNNLGVRSSRGTFILLLNNDATLTDQSLPPLTTSLAPESIAAVTSFVITDGTPKQFYEMNGTVNFLGYNIMRHFTDMRNIFYAGGTALMFKKEIVGEPFPEDYFLYHEDVYLSWRLRLRGYTVRMEPGSLVYHRGNATTKNESSVRITFYQVRNRLLNLFLMYESKTLMKLIPFLAVDMFATLGKSMVSVSKSFWGTLNAYWWLVTNLRLISIHRASLQRERKVADESILALMSPDVVDESRSPQLLSGLNSLARLYARMAQLPYHIPDNKM
jgi:GT2 family glycosyltransferase